MASLVGQGLGFIGCLKEPGKLEIMGRELTGRIHRLDLGVRGSGFRVFSWLPGYWV